MNIRGLLFVVFLVTISVLFYQAKLIWDLIAPLIWGLGLQGVCFAGIGLLVLVLAYRFFKHK